METFKVLVVEDDQTTQLLLVTVLQRWGYSVSATDTAEQAIELIVRELPNIIITDWMLQGMNGPTLCKKIRDLDMPHYVYMIIVTALSDVSHVVTGLESGADDFLRKPVNFLELKVRLAAGQRIIRLEGTLRTQNEHLSAITDKLNHINTELLVAESKIRQDMAFADKIQRNLLPENDVRLNDVAFYYLYSPSMYVSGDILNYFKLNDDRVCFYVIDVCGHGIASSMMSFSISKIISQTIDFNACAKQPGEDGNIFDIPHNFVEHLNGIFYKNNDYSLYFSMIFGFIDTRTQSLSFCQAGHPYPIFQPRGACPELLGRGGFPVALLQEPNYDSITLSYQTGDRLYFYSDGVTDCSNDEGSFFGSQNLLDFLAHNASLPFDRLFADLENNLLDWNGSTKFDDDVSILGIEFV